MSQKTHFTTRMNKSKALYGDTFNRRKKIFFLWFMIGCIFSVFIHFFIFRKIGTLEIASFNPASFDSVVPRRFHLESVKIDPKLLEEPENKKVTILSQPVEVSLSEEKDFPSQSSLHHNELKPQILDNKQLLGEKPQALLENNIIPETLQQPNQPIVSFDPITKESDLGDFKVNQTNGSSAYSELDQLIEQKAPLTSKTAPILLPTDLLFEYDADRLKTDAEESLKKLALLIQRNPKAQFIVEGFTDGFGSDEYNLDLSSRRANSIKQWLINKEHVNPDQIQAYGLGKTHFIVPSDGTIQQQSLNRRVEIVIRQNQNP